MHLCKELFRLKYPNFENPWILIFISIKNRWFYAIVHKKDKYQQKIDNWTWTCRVEVSLGLAIDLLYLPRLQTNVMGFTGWPLGLIRFVQYIFFLRKLQVVGYGSMNQVFFNTSVQPLVWNLWDYTNISGTWRQLSIGSGIGFAGWWWRLMVGLTLWIWSGCGLWVSWIWFPLWWMAFVWVLWFDGMTNTTMNFFFFGNESVKLLIVPKA